MHIQPFALTGGAHQALVEGDVRTQAGDFFIALGQRGLDLGVGGAADAIRYRQGGFALAQSPQLVLLPVELLLHLLQTPDGV